MIALRLRHKLTGHQVSNGGLGRVEGPHRVESAGERPLSATGPYSRSWPEADADDRQLHDPWLPAVLWRSGRSRASLPNEINRYSVGTKNKDLQLGADGSLTIHMQTRAPSDAAQRANWLPAPKGDFSLYLRAYWPQTAVTDGSWTPPPVKRLT